MKKKFFSSLLLGLLVLGTTGTVTSCKDYQDDINANTQAIATLQSSLDKAKSDLTAEITSLKSQLADNTAKLAALQQQVQDAASKAALDAEIARAKEAELALTNRIAAAETTLNDLKALITDLQNNKVDKTEFTEKITDIYAKLEAVNTGLGNALTSIDELKKGLADEAAAREAVVKDLQQQIDALEAWKKSLESGGGAADLIKKIQDVQKSLQDQITALDSKVGANTSDIATLKQAIEALNNKVNELSADINVLNVFCTAQLRSLVFMPSTYYWGVEALEASTLNYTKYTDFTGKNWVDGNADVKEPVGYDSDARYKSTDGSTALALVAHYHMNPGTAKTPDDVTILDGDKEYINTRASEAVISVKEENGKKLFSKTGDRLDVTLKFNDPSKIKSVLDDQMITVFAAQAHYKSADKDTTVTSDYAAVYKKTLTGLVVAHTQKGYENDTYGPSAIAANLQNLSAFDFGKAQDNLHSVNNFADKLNLIPDVFQAMKQANQDQMVYNQTIDLNALVQTRYMDGTNLVVLTAQQLKDYGLKYKFELTGSFEGTNTTSEAAHAGINAMGIFRAQKPQTDGKAYSWSAYDAYLNTITDQETYDAELRAHSVGRQPIVRVALVDTVNNNRVIDYGYIKIKFIDKTQAVTVKPSLNITYTGDPLTYNSDCTTGDYVFKTTWNQIEYDVLSLVKLHKEEFDANYQQDGILITEGGVVKQYSAADVMKKIAAGSAEEAAVQTPNIGVVNNNYDANSPETQTFTWTISGEEIVKALYGKTTATPMQIAVRYASKDTQKYPDIYVILSTGAITINTNSGKFLADDGSDRIKEYWYKDNGNSAADHGLVEIHAQTLSPEDPNAGTIANKFDDRFSDVFYGNAIKLAELTDNTAGKEFAEANRLYNFVFSSKNLDKVFTGVTADGKTVKWTLKVSDDGKSLRAYKKNGTQIPEQTVATINGGWADASGIKSQLVNYNGPVEANMTEAAKSLLNYAAHNKLADDVLKAIIALQVKTKKCDHMLTLTNDEFNVRFLRPINATGVEGQSLEDAQDKVQKIALKDLVNLTDWRDYDFATHPNYWTFYNVKDIKVVGNVTKGTIADQTSGIINGVIYTTMSNAGTANSLDDKVLQSTVSNNVLLRQIEKDAEPNGEYGYILYENLSSAVQTFTVRIPLEVTYEWGSVFTTVDVTIKNTHANAKRF